MLLREVAQQAQPTPTWQGVITLALFLAGFAYLGWRRGYRRELVALMGIVLGHRVWTTSLGHRLVIWINQLYVMAKIGIDARFDVRKMMELAAHMGQIKPLVPLEREGDFLFFAFLLLVLLGYGMGHAKCCVGNLLRRFLETPRSLVGALLGMVNGYLLVLWLFPTLFAVLPGAAARQPSAARMAGGATSRDVLAKGVHDLAAIFGLEANQLLLLVVGALVLWVAWRSR